MTAGARRVAATLDAGTGPLPENAVEHWRRAAEIRTEWLVRGLCTDPADRVTAENSLTLIYARSGRPRPRFVWVDSPRAAVPRLVGLPTLDELYRWVMSPPGRGAPPAASDIAASVSRLRSGLDGCIEPPWFEACRPRSKQGERSGPKREKGEPWPVLAPLDALRAGIPFREVLRQGVREALHASLGTGYFQPVRAALSAAACAGPAARLNAGPGTGGPLPVCWYGQQDASWIAYYDVWRRLGLARFGGADDAHLDAWAALARSGGWWWPGEHVCVVVERPSSVLTEPVPAALHGEVRLCRGPQAPVEYRDCWRPTLT